jgi:hypothetical protein
MKSDQYIKGSVRRSQLITTYGIGSVVALGDESFMVAGMDHWPPAIPDIHEPRLERILRVHGFVSPPATERRDIPVVRFPRMYYCPVCRRLDTYGFFTSSPDNKCSKCNVDLVPSRFVIACPRGHIDDFPYFAWVHEERPNNPGENHKLAIKAGGASASLSDIVVTCSCGAKATMQGSFGKLALKGISRCHGYRPWLGDREACDEIPRTLQRGASNVWFPVVRSALSIPPWSEGAFKVLNRHWTFMRAVPDEALAATIRGSGIAHGTPYSVDDLTAAARERRRREQDGSEPEDPNDELRRQEYSALIHGMPEKSGMQDFVCVPVPDIAPELAEWIDHIAQVKRLHEVRVLQSFTRLQASSPAEPPEHRASLTLRDQTDWLPGIIVLGEGIFLHLDTARLAGWENREDVCARVAHINRNYKNSFIGGNADREITPRLILIHTLSHVLIDQFALEAGYPAASLRERLYVSDEMAGLLIYTATTDAAGSLGGVVALASKERLAVSFLEAIARTSWCSADPLCIEAEATGFDSLNLAACHACGLLPETSCEEANVLLDRGLLTGTPSQPELGYFSSLV